MEAYSIEETKLICKYKFSYSNIKVIGFISGLVGNADKVGEDFYRAIFNSCDSRIPYNERKPYSKQEAINCINDTKFAETLIKLHNKGKFNNLSATLGFVGIPYYANQDYILPYRIETKPDETQIIHKLIHWANIRDDLLIYLKYYYMRYNTNFNPLSYIGQKYETDEEWAEFINILISEIVKNKITINFDYMYEKTLIKSMIEEYKCFPKLFTLPLKQLTFDLPDTKPACEIPKKNKTDKSIDTRTSTI
jgi:hypothetical protein